MASNPCIDAAKAVGGEDLTDKQLEEILSVLDVKAARALREEPGIDQRTAYQKAAAELQAERKLEILIAKRQRAMNVAAKQKRERFYERAQAEGMPLDKAIQAQLVGTEGPFTGAGNSVDAMAHGLEDSALVGPMIAELDAAGLMDVARLKDPDFESRVAHEMARINGDDTIPATKDKYAAKMAEIFVKYTERGRHLQNGAGAFIRKMPGYITRQMHDQVEIYRAGKQAWVEKIKPLLHPRVFDGVADVDKFLGQTWRNLASGNHEKTGGGSDWLGGFEGPGNLAKRASAERVLHFKDPAAWLEYNTMFGRKSLFESVLGNLHYAARNTAIMRTWGTNPEAAFKADIKQFKQQARDSDDIAAVHALDAPSLRWAFDELNGGTQIKGNPTLAMWGGAFRTGVNMASLGGVVLSSIPDAAVRASVLRHNGMPLTEAWRETLDAAFHALQLPEEKTRAAKMLNVGVQGMIGGIFHRFSAVDNAPGTMVKANQAFFKYTLLTAWTDGWSRWMGITLANHMGNLAADGKAFADIDTLHQTTLRRYGIGAAEWDVLRQSEVFDADGAGLLMPDKARELSDAAVSNYLRTTGIVETPSARDIANAREDLATKLSTYYADQVRESLTMGGARERSLLGMGLSRGTVAGEMARIVMQFKQFPLTFMTKHLNREINRGGKLDKGGIGHLMAATTALGFVSVYVGALAKGHTVQQPEDAQGYAGLMAQSMIKGGSAGLLGDAIFSSAEGGYQRLAGNILGPGIGKTIGPASDILAAAADGRDPSAKALKAGIGLIPYNNLFYTRLALDHMFLHGLQETVNPGYLRRYERFVAREQNREWWLPPTSAMNQ